VNAVDTWDPINDPEERACQAALDEGDLAVLRDVERALGDGLQLKDWWERKEAAGGYAREFELVRTHNRATRVTGFFDETVLGGRPFPLVGLVQEMLFDQPKQATPERVRDELREFVLHYFLRVSSFLRPDASVARDQSTKGDVACPLQPFSLCPERTDTQAGFGYAQLYYKLRGSGFVGKFPAHLRPRVIDLRRLYDIYEWVVLQVKLFNFNIAYTPFAGRAFTLTLPLREELYIVISRDFIKDEAEPTPGLLGRYGLGYALLRPAPHRTLFAYGPGEFEAGFQLIDFELHRDGASYVRMAFVSNRPRQVLRVNLNPISLAFGVADLLTCGLASNLLAPVRAALEPLAPGVDNFDPVTTYIALANLLTGGLAEDRLCASLETLEQNPMLLTHFMEHYNLIAGALLTWRGVSNWLDAQAIPANVRTGVSS
jgi:hypothetical protein